MKVTLTYLFTTTAHLTTVSIGALTSTWNIQMNSVLFIALDFSVDHASKTLAKF